MLTAEIRRLADRDHVLTTRALPTARRALSALAIAGELIAVHPGVYLDAAVGDDPWWRIRAAHAYAPDGVLTGPSAAWIYYGSELHPDPLTGRVAPPPSVHELWVPRRAHAHASVRLSQCVVPAEHRRHACPSDQGQMMALYQSSSDTVPVISEVLLAVLRSPQDDGQSLMGLMSGTSIDLAHAQAVLALLMWLPGQPQRRRTLRPLRDNPWSEAERLMLAELRRRRILGWRANATVRTRHRTWTVDILFKAERLVVEIDGYAYHASREAFERDRVRNNDLVRAGYRILHLTWSMITEDLDGVIELIRSMLKA